MRGYSEFASCRKCGYAHVSVKYKADSDSLERKCERCGYTWTEPPIHPEPA